ncbi:hypothetical protein G7077_02780 [Sphingomonas piscis]|uniref:Uncharacterized protein n=1 Tax=Sphingomonas piscis TaxID=2714943 RepID=A0A6G7YMM1_9SPHN|nr:hypothetical protein [Sphingomonas piscis]QIK77995.1 hypothetical protein G7077_02780 [Sphingomonas piscis]
MKFLLFPGGIRGFGVMAGLAVAIVGIIYSPAALAFPHFKQIGTTKIYSEAPIPEVMAERIQRADALLAASPLTVPELRRTLVLTEGGWRWKVLAAGNWGAIALRRPFSSALLFNNADILADRVRNGAPRGGVRTLSGTIAHESVHLLTARRYGEVRLARMPEWKREGYADYVAQETSISANDEAQVREVSPNSPLLRYYAAHRRVKQLLDGDGVSVDELLSKD